MNQLRIKKKDPTIKLKKIELTSSQRYQSLSPTNQKQYQGRQSSHISYKKQLLSIRNSFRQSQDPSKFNKFNDRSLDINERVHSLTLKKTKKLLHRSNQKYKKVDKKQAIIIAKTSFQKITQEKSPYMQKSKKNQGSRKHRNLPEQIQTRISQKLEAQLIQQKRNNQVIINRTNSIKKEKSRYRVNSTFARLDSQTKQQEKTINNSLMSKQTIETAKKLIKSGQNRQALLIVKDLYKKNSSNLQILQVFAISWYNLGDFQKSIEFCEQIIQYDPLYSSEIFIIGSLAYTKLKTFAKALQTIYLGQEKFPENAQIFYYKGKILDHIKQYEKAGKAFAISYQICPKGQTLIQLANCYRHLNQQQKQIKIYDKILLLHQKQVDFACILNKKIDILIKNNRFNEIVNLFNQIQKNLFSKRQLWNSDLKCQILFKISIAYFKLGRFTLTVDIYTKAYFILQDCAQSNSEFYFIKSYKMMMIIKIIQKNYYDASYLIEALEKYSSFNILEQHSDFFLSMLCRFINGALHLIKRNYKEGIQILSGLQIKLHQNFGILKDQNVSKLANCLQDQLAYMAIRNNIHIFLSYGLFCLGQFEFSKTAIKKQKEIFNDPLYQKSLAYNNYLCQTFLLYEQRQYENCLQKIKQAKLLFPNKMEVHFYEAIILIQILLLSRPQKNNGCLKQTQIQDFKTNQAIIINKIKSNFIKALQYVSGSANNTTASILYHKCIFHVFLQEWKQSLHSIDECISKSDDNYWRYYYTKALVLALVHNFQDSMVELQIAINSSGRQKAECFLLRSKCLQIQGHGNEAFRDLQQYISLKPQDEDIHKYAGQILFQNGAFQDALLAFQHHEIQLTQQNYDYFMTKGKTNFLIGNFQKAHIDMMLAYSLRTNQLDVKFDSMVVKLIQKILAEVNKKIYQQQSLIDLLRQTQQIFNIEKQKNFGKIFKKVDFYCLMGIIYIFLREFDKAIQAFSQSIEEKQKMTMIQMQQEDTDSVNQQLKTTLSELQKQSTDVKAFNNQMKYNIFLCYLMKEDKQKAKNILNSIHINQTQIFHDTFYYFKEIIFNHFNPKFEKQEIFPNKNKLSQFIKPLIIPKTQLKLKLCMPFPKVEPPQIFPQFDVGLIKAFSIYGIQGKPQAPWIVMQQNSIKFTQKIQKVSRLNFNDSDSSRTEIIDLQKSKISQKTLLKNRTRKNSSIEFESKRNYLN